MSDESISRIMQRLEAVLREEIAKAEEADCSKAGHKFTRVYFDDEHRERGVIGANICFSCGFINQVNVKF